MKTLIQPREIMSAMADGQLNAEDFAAALVLCKHEESLTETWNTYHLIGEILRSPDVVMAASELAFIDRLNQRLKKEPSIFTAPSIPSVDSNLVTPLITNSATKITNHREPASNDVNFRWKVVAGFASLTALIAIAWSATGLLDSALTPQLAQNARPQQVLVASPEGPIVRDSRLEELLAAHRQFGALSALQAPSGFLRNATFETFQSPER